MRQFPESPGVYIMRDRTGTPIYIGKAVNLRARVRSYFLDAHADRAQIPLMLSRLHDIDWIATGNEIEALVLEANLIRSRKPRFNVQLKDDKHFPYLKVTVREAFPRLVVARRVERDGAKYFGPYTDARAMRRLMRFARMIFKLRDCGKKLPLKRPQRPCINYEMGRCSGACAGKISQEEYRRNVDMLIRFLQGRRRDLRSLLTSRMQEASDSLDFERAALVRDQIKLLEDASKMQRVDLRLPELDCDVFGLFRGDRHACMAVLTVREGLLVSTKRFFMSRDIWNGGEENHDHVVVQYYLSSSATAPSEVLVPSDSGFDGEALERWFESQFESRVSVVMPGRGARRKLIDMAVHNARLALAQRLPRDPEADVADLQAALGLPTRPRVIEAFDISNLGTSHPVAGMVRFVDGEPDKSGYRRYRIRSVAGQDDFAMMMEVVRRRLARIETEGGELADLLLIDGGKGQLSAATAALRDFSRAPVAVALAKKEELLFSPFKDKPVGLPPTHPGRKLAERVRDEVHRWAVSYHRTVRAKQYRGSSLEKISGIGPSRSRALLRRFGSLKGLKKASVEQIASVEGISDETAAALKRTIGEA